MHGLLKLTPPRMLGAYEPEHLLVGHGEGVHGPEAATALQRALSRSRLVVLQRGRCAPARGCEERGGGLERPDSRCSPAAPRVASVTRVQR